MKKHFFNFLGCVLLLQLFTTTAFATSKISTQSGNWSAASTWGGSPAPAAGDDVIILGGFTVTVDLSNATCLSIQLGGSSDNLGAGTLLFNNGSQLTVSGSVNIGPNNDKTTPGSLGMAAGGTLVCESIAVDRLGTWNSGTGTIQLIASNTIPADNNVNFNNLTIAGGTTTLSRNTTVNGSLHIQAGAALTCGNNTFSIGGDWVNNGTFTGTGGTVIFTKNGNASISGTGANNFNLIKEDMGIGVTNILEVLATNFTAPDPFLTIVNGTFKISGSFSFSNSFFAGPAYSIDPTAGFWINNPNVTVTGQAANVSVRGLLRITAGNYLVGTAIDNSLNYVTGSTILIEGGSLDIAGRLTRNNSTQTTSYTQTGGTVTVVGIGSTDPTFAGFDLGVVGSSFTMSGGTIIVKDATSAPADFLNLSSVTNFNWWHHPVG